MRTQQSGFTLVEIAIVLVIIGLLLGGVLKGQELITQAKIKNVANDFNGITAAVYSYQDRFKALPGDDGGATRWNTGTSHVEGDGNGTVAGDFNSTDNAVESRKFWIHLRKAGFIAGDSNSGQQPPNAAGGLTGVQTTALGLGGLAVCMTNLPTKIAEAVDVQFDDGNPNTGTVRAMISAAVMPTVTPVGVAYTDDGSSIYTVCKQL